MANSLAWISAGAVSSCTTIADDDSSGASAVSIDFNAVGVYIGRQFTAGSTYSLCKVILQLSQGTSTAATVEIWSDDGGSPGTPSAKIGTGSISKDLSGIGGSKTPVSFTGMSVSMVSGTKYWYIVKSGNGKNGTFVWYYTFSGGQNTKSSDDGISWFVYSGNTLFDFTTYQ